MPEQATQLLNELRAIGLPMTSRYVFERPARDTDGATETVSHYLAWTTSRERAEQASDLGAVLRPYKSRDAQFSGWEIRVTVTE
jgi:hypothetical protein